MAVKIDGPRLPAASGETKSLVVLLHGYGADGNDLFGLAQPLSSILPDTAFVSPNAPERCANNPMGYQWFPIPWLDGSSEEAMQDGFAAAVETLNMFLDEELAAHGLDESSCALVGFSQGTMMSLHVGPRRSTELAGIVGFSGRLAGEAAGAAKPPVLLIHGDMDEMIPVAEMHSAREALAGAGFAVRWHVSKGVGHGIAQDGLQLAAGFLQDVLN
ncbi:MAG: dienelactone hydrolase family protein [Pseudomonadota bacterium]